MLISGIEQNFESMFITMDEPSAKEEDGLLRTVYLMATSYHEDDAGTRNHLEGIALELCGKNGKRFKRIGNFNISLEWDGSPDYEASKEPLKQAMRLVKEAETRVIELV
jgi:hypothetical protein